MSLWTKVVPLELSKLCYIERYYEQLSLSSNLLYWEILMNNYLWLLTQIWRVRWKHYWNLCPTGWVLWCSWFVLKGKKGKLPPITSKRHLEDKCYCPYFPWHTRDWYNQRHVSPALLHQHQKKPGVCFYSWVSGASQAGPEQQTITIKRLVH